jgi:CheY-like chemotaxis protein
MELDGVLRGMDKSRPSSLSPEDGNPHGPASSAGLEFSPCAWFSHALNILVAEDDATLGEALVSFLQEKGHQADLARDGCQALDWLRQRNYSLVITDLVMPGADGLEVLRASRQCQPPPLVVIMTGYASIDTAIEAIHQGAYEYLRKPFKLQEIEIAVANAARLLHLHRENQRLVQSLQELRAQLAILKTRSLPDPEAPETDASPAGLVLPLPLGPGGWVEPVRPHQSDLERLHHLYRESLLTENEYQVLKQRLLI